MRKNVFVPTFVIIKIPLNKSKGRVLTSYNQALLIQLI